MTGGQAVMFLDEATTFYEQLESGTASQNKGTTATGVGAATALTLFDGGTWSKTLSGGRSRSKDSKEDADDRSEGDRMNSTQGSKHVAGGVLEDGLHDTIAT